MVQRLTRRTSPDHEKIVGSIPALGIHVFYLLVLICFVILVEYPSSRIIEVEEYALLEGLCGTSSGLDNKCTALHNPFSTLEEHWDRVHI